MKDLLTVGQLPLFWEAAGRSPDLVLVDARGELERAAVVHHRPWAQRGWRIAELPASNAPPADRAAELARLSLPMVLVRAAEAPVPAVADELFLLTDDVRSFTRSADGRLSLGGEPQVPDPARVPDLTGSTRVSLVLDREERLAGVDLPLELELELDAGSHVIGLRVESAHAGALPAPAWWRVDAAGRVRLRVDLTARRGGDQWNLSIDGGRLARVEGPAGAAAGPPPARLAVILDRTCPDEAGWSGARTLAVSGRAREADPFARPGTTEAGYRELNRAVRSGLERALREGLAGRDVHVDAWAFADVPGDGVAPLEGVDHPDVAVQALGAGPPDRLEGWLARATYLPGLDIWDPLEEALEQAVAALASDISRRGAVLIVGNSPPQVLADAGSPFVDLAAAAGFPTAFRRYGPGWETALERCRAEGVRVAYAFLEHDVFAPGEQRDHEAFARVARRVREGLERCVPLVRGPASEEGTRRAVGEALALLSRPEPRPCGVRLVRA